MPIKVNEIFGPTLQGEGRNAGLPVMFVRLALCNLYCTWCDTPHTWNWEGSDYQHPEKFDMSKELHVMTDAEILDRVIGFGPKAVVFSGGEPLLQQKQLIPLLWTLKQGDYWIEIETNGTVLPKPEIFKLASQINCSPKLAHSGCAEKHRLKPVALQEMSLHENVDFKFVVSQKSDIEEILELVKRYNLTKVLLMPLGKTPSELAYHTGLVQDLSAKYGFLFTTRLSVESNGNERGI